MDWTKRYNFFLFDFDGLLVNTEEVHFKAYQLMCKKHGVELMWSFEKYCSFAHKSAIGLKEALQREFPQLFDTPWERLYQEKKKAYFKLIEEGQVDLMPGVAKLLKHLE